jgi:adenine-specific DNA-methyltransferase
VPPRLGPSDVDPATAAKHNGVEVDRRRLLGAYYTPDDLAGILVQWALAHSAGTVLDPCFGGCAFLKAAARVLRAKGVQDSGRFVYGVDIDSTCMEHVHATEDLEPENCIVSDFLEIRPGDIAGAPFEAVVGNPPYVRHHWLKGATRSAARALIEDSPVPLPATASMWAYFVVHSLSFLRPMGRLAMLVPEAILQADYAAPIRDALAARFSHVSLIHVRDRLFEGTDEPVVVVAGAGFGKQGKVSIEAVETADDLVGVLGGCASRRRSRYVTAANGRSVSTPVLEFLEALDASKSVRHFGDFATARIGLVTGSNSHFIRNQHDLVQRGIPSKALVPVVSRTTWLTGLDFRVEDHARLTDTDRRAHLVRPTPALENNKGVVGWIAEGVAAGVHARFKCAKRSPWFRVELSQAPDALATSTRLGSPLLVLNRPRYFCTNTLYAVSWRAGFGVEPEVVAIGFLTSAVSVWAELHGRRYGGGVLKLDLRTLVKVPVPLAVEARGAFEDIDELLRSGREAEARALADRVVLVQGLGVQKSDVRRLRRAQGDLTTQRVPPERRANGG